MLDLPKCTPLKKIIKDPKGLTKLNLNIDKIDKYLENNKSYSLLNILYAVGSSILVILIA